MDGSTGKGAGEKEHTVAMRESPAGDSGVTTLVQQLDQFRQALDASPATLAAATTVTADEATVAALVAKLGTFRAALGDDERRLLDGMLAAASLGSGDVEGYGLSGLGARQVALAAVMLLGVATATLGTATSGTAHAAPSDSPSLNGNMGGGNMGGSNTGGSNMSGGGMGGSNTGGSTGGTNMSGGTRGPTTGGTVASGGTMTGGGTMGGGGTMTGGGTTTPPTMGSGTTQPPRPPGTGPSITIDVTANGINIAPGGPGGVTVRGAINNPDPFLEAIRQAEAEQAAAAQAAAAQAAADAAAAQAAQRPPLTASDFTSPHTQHAPPVVPTATNEHDHQVFQQAAVSQINREIAATEADRDKIQSLTERARNDGERQRLSQLFQDLTAERERLVQQRQGVLSQVWSAQTTRETNAAQAAARAHEEEVRNPTTEEGMVENIERARESERTQAQRADGMLPPGMQNWTH